jgi:predicted DNA-binding transcriptional regulator AlpA
VTPEELHRLPAVLDVPTAACVLGVGRSAAYTMVKSGTWPTPVLRLGRRIRIPSAPLLSLLALGPVQEGNGWRQRTANESPAPDELQDHEVGEHAR